MCHMAHNAPILPSLWEGDTRFRGNDEGYKVGIA
jgi:hypothetical protein